MIHDKRRREKFIRSVLGGVIGGGFATLLIMRAEAGESPAPPPEASQLASACRGLAPRDGWDKPAPPARIYGNTWYVGTCGITALLVTSDKGHVLVDGGVEGAAPLVAANIEKLGFRLQDVKWIVSSHEHWDHVAALAELKRLTGAKVAALGKAAAVLATGKANAEDPQFAQLDDFPPVTVDRVLPDDGQLRVGPLRLTVRATPAHAPGSASWRWTSCEEARCRTVTYADSTSLISAEGYRYLDHPQRIAEAQEGLARIESMPCDILVTPHPSASDLFPRLAGAMPLGDADACKRYVAGARVSFAERLERERSVAR